MTAEKLVAHPAEVETIEVVAPDPFDLSRLRLSQNYTETVGVKKLLRTVPVRKPNKQDFIRVHPDAAYRENFPMVELKEDREQYLVGGADLAAELATEIINVSLFTAISHLSLRAICCVRTGRRIRDSGHGLTRSSIRRCRPVCCTQRLVGTFILVRTPIRDRCAILRCKQTAQKFCASPPVSPPKAASKFARRRRLLDRGASRSSRCRYRDHAPCDGRGFPCGSRRLRNRD